MTSYYFLLVFKIVESLQCILKTFFLCCFHERRKQKKYWFRRTAEVMLSDRFDRTETNVNH